MQLAMTDDAFVKTAYQSYQTGLTTDLVQNNEDPQSTWSKFENKFS
ncbi:hypothetical protein KKG31_01610 [Patescibacteria group bacterium]|nr:hypothetical protein [Patescibacteria group bacterium]MBU1757872.1 hypothetical protein [Patescibacteria group bacterium]